MGSPPFVSDELKTRETHPSFTRFDAALGSLLRACYGAILGGLPVLLCLFLRPAHRSPYLLAYPAVILAAWVWGLPASVACAAVSGGLIEYFIFLTGRMPVAESPEGWPYRSLFFLGGSVMVGALTRSAALQRQKAVTDVLSQRLLLAQAEAAVATEKAIATELALENEVRTHMALDGANVGLWEWDIASQKSKWSHGYYRLHGLEPDDSASYATWRKCVHPDDIERVETAIRRAIAERTSFLEEYRIRRGDGSIRWIACQGTAITNHAGEVIRVSGFGGDVTRRKLSDLALLQNEKLVIAGRLIATIAHEINNPLDAAMNILYLLRSGVSLDAQPTLLDDAALQLDRIAQISRQTLNFSRASVRTALIKPSDLIDEALRLIGPKLRLAQIEVSTEVRADTAFYCDRREAQQILTNLLNNAIEATQGPGRLRIRIANSTDWRRRKHPGIRITIADTGTGMSRDILRRIAEPFFTTREGAATGLGMWVVKELIRKQNGTLSISSSTRAAHHGTAVSLFIPFAVGPVRPTGTSVAERQPAL